MAALRGSPADVEERLIARVTELVSELGAPLAGVREALTLVRARGMRVALASSSPTRVIQATLAKLGILGAFEVVRSAEHETHGKPVTHELLDRLDRAL